MPEIQGVPGFLHKLWAILEDQTTGDIVSWSNVGVTCTFVVKDPIRFSSEILPAYFKHNNMASFVRQLNMYGFNKISRDPAHNALMTIKGAMSPCNFAPPNTTNSLQKNSVEFYHVYFVKDQPQLLGSIKRKHPPSIVMSQHNNQPSFLLYGEDGGSSSCHMPSGSAKRRGYIDVRQMKKRQEEISKLLAETRRENDSLYGELEDLRKKHCEQMHLVNDIISCVFHQYQNHALHSDTDSSDNNHLSDGYDAARLTCATALMQLKASMPSNRPSNDRQPRAIEGCSSNPVKGEEFDGGEAVQAVGPSNSRKRRAKDRNRHLTLAATAVTAKKTVTTTVKSSSFDVILASPAAASSSNSTDSPTFATENKAAFATRQISREELVSHLGAMDDGLQRFWSLGYSSTPSDEYSPPVCVGGACGTPPADGKPPPSTLEPNVVGSNVFDDFENRPEERNDCDKARSDDKENLMPPGVNIFPASVSSDVPISALLTPTSGDPRIEPVPGPATDRSRDCSPISSGGQPQTSSALLMTPVARRCNEAGRC